MPSADDYPVINATFEQNEELLKSLLSDSTYCVDEATEEGITALWCACYVGSSSCLSILLEYQADPNIADVVNQTPLFVASYQGSEENVKLLLDYGASLYHQDYQNRTVLHAAADAGNAKIITMILDHNHSHPPSTDIKIALVDFGDKDNRTALHYAAIGNQCDCVDSLVAGGANVNVVDNNLSTPLHLASEIGHDYVVDILIDDNANMEAVDKQGRTALHIACTEGKGYCVDLLIANGSEIMSLDGNGLSPLHLSVLNGQIEIVKLLLDGAEVDTFDEDGTEVPFRNAAHPNVVDKNGRTCMHAAAELGDVVLCELLHQRGTDLHLKDNSGRSPLHYCGMWSQAGCVDWFLIKNIEVDDLDDANRTCLHYACYFGNYQVVHTLLRRSADVNASDINGDTPLLCALHEYDNNDKSEIIQLLLEYGANLLQTNKLQRNSFHIGACTGDIETLELLLEHSCNEDSSWSESEEPSIPELVNVPDIYGLTPLHMAAANSQYDVLEFLIQQGGNPNLCDTAGCSVLHWACRSGSIDCIDVLLHQSFRANATERDRQGHTSLTIAAYSGAKDCIRSLLEAGLSPMDRDRSGRTPLHGACFNGHAVILNMFLGCDGVQLDYVCNAGRTALHRAAARGHLDITKILLTNEASVNATDPNGITPLMLAHYYGHHDVAELLLSSGADETKLDGKGRSWKHYAEKGLKRRVAKFDKYQENDETITLERPEKPTNEEEIQILTPTLDTPVTLVDTEPTTPVPEIIDENNEVSEETSKDELILSPPARVDTPILQVVEEVADTDSKEESNEESKEEIAEEEEEEEKPKEEPKEDVKIPEEPEEIPEEEPKEDIDSSAIKEEPKEDIVPDTKEDIVVPEKTDNIATEQVENKEEPKEESTKDKQNPLPDETDKLNEIPVEEIVPEEKDNVPPKTNISENKVQPTVEPSPPINRSAEIPVVEPEEEVEEERPSPGGITKFVRDIILSCFSPLLVIFFPRQD